MNAVLPKSLEEFVDQQVKAGRYESASAVIQDALERLERDVQMFPSDQSTQALEACYAAETASEKDWENRTAQASSLNAEGF